MEQRRLITYVITCVVFSSVWFYLIVPTFFPQLVQKPPVKPDAANEQKLADGEVKPADVNAKPATPDTKPAEEGRPAAAEVKPPVEVTSYPYREVVLGSLDPKSNYYYQVSLTSKGAGVARIELNDPRYSTDTDRAVPLAVVGNNHNPELATLQTNIPYIDDQLKGKSGKLDVINWKVNEELTKDDTAVFEYPSPDGKVTVRRTYTIQNGKADARDTDPTGYLLKTKIEFINQSGEELKLSYNSHGPVGLPLENVDNIQRFRNLQFGMLNVEGGVRHVQVTAGELANQFEEAQTENDPKKVETYTGMFQFLGQDVQYFAALLHPVGSQLESSYIERVVPYLNLPGRDRNHTDFGFTFESKPVSVAKGETVGHEYQLFAGPKRSPLLASLRADDIMEYGWFGSIAKLMLSMMNIFHRYLFLPYGLCIIMLTVIVRGAMFPLSRKQVQGAQKMKELQPKIKELQTKYADDKEKLARAQMELFAKAGYNPLAGCLPMLFQLPIFIALYSALQHSVDLRMASFLWVDNLAAPDHLFTLPFTLPFIGTNSFNLLPILTIVLFIVQQKMFMPPPTNEEQAMQQKMMSYMMVFMGFMFYKVPAGLCVYFIASSLWGLAERKLLDWTGANEPPAPTDDKKADVVKKPGYFSNLMKQLDQAANDPQAKQLSKTKKPS
jgi:YidC/Oxa1 family membrane protein insertase